MIKFRGKRKDNGEWVYGNLVKQGDRFYIIENRSIPKDCIPAEVIYFGKDAIIPVVPETVEQFTTKKDENGKEIYEGDKVVKQFENPKGNPLEREIIVKIPDFYFDWFGLEGKFRIIGTIHDKGEGE
jgi:uncharacterized phage protein (TIGR01671 family)